MASSSARDTPKLDCEQTATSQVAPLTNTQHTRNDGKHAPEPAATSLVAVGKQLARLKASTAATQCRAEHPVMPKHELQGTQQMVTAHSSKPWRTDRTSSLEAPMLSTCTSLEFRPSISARLPSISPFSCSTLGVRVATARSASAKRCCNDSPFDLLCCRSLSRLASASFAASSSRRTSASCE
jgi:hypothetical protein